MEQPVNVEATIYGILNEIQVMGANDSERDAITKILDAYKKGHLEGGEAIIAAENIRDSKQDR